MADAFRRVPLLLLATLLLVLVVSLRICVIVRGLGSRRKRRTARKATMERRETSSGLHKRAINFSTPNRAVPARRAPAYDPTLYSHLPPHEQPLPLDPEEEWLEDLSHTLPLGSESMQDWMGSHCRQREAERSRHLFSAMLEEGIDGGKTKIVDLDFGLSSGTAAPVRNSCASSHVATTTVRQTSLHGAGMAGRGARSCPVNGIADGCRPTPSFSRGAGTSGDKATTVLSPHSAMPSPPPRRSVAALVANTTTTSPEEIARHVWESFSQQMHGPTAENITNGVSRMRVGSDADADDTRRATGDESSKFHCEDEADNAERLVIRPLGVRGGGRGGCRRQQNRGSRGDERLYLEIDNMSRGNKTIYPDNLADTSACGEVQMSGDTQLSPSVAGESIAEGDAGDGNDEDGGSARESEFSAGSTGDAEKRKNMREQTFNTTAEVMEKHGALMADTVQRASKRQFSILERQCDILKREVDAQKRHNETSDEANRMMCSAFMEIVKTIRDRS
ncbi:hypothetical protein CBR_g28891 [Chara braunii]|uniref:Uncharacterized protein n=1 Tax=Chara braunii TaxID=69332 RepID=A0A388LA29_CHABU|nr:hypothetical protein CBR_g28891 [Chara braunii]|eukprot:GBG79175.1 hypothetical protein CBR_g28891 [Chara braunii]